MLKSKKKQMLTIEDFTYKLEGEQRKIIHFLHQWFENEFTLLCKIRYKIPFYYRKSWICYLNPVKGGKIELAFIRGNELSNEQRLLDFKDRVQVAGVEFGSVAEIKPEILQEIIHEAILLDEVTPYKSNKKN